MTQSSERLSISRSQLFSVISFSVTLKQLNGNTVSLCCGFQAAESLFSKRIRTCICYRSVTVVFRQVILQVLVAWLMNVLDDLFLVLNMLSHLLQTKLFFHLPQECSPPRQDALIEFYVRAHTPQWMFYYSIGFALVYKEQFCVSIHTPVISGKFLTIAVSCFLSQPVQLP